MENHMQLLSVFRELYESNLSARESNVASLEMLLNPSLSGLDEDQVKNVIGNTKVITEDERGEIIGWFLNYSGFKIGSFFPSANTAYVSEAYYYYKNALESIQKLNVQKEDWLEIVDIGCGYGLQSYMFISNKCNYTGIDETHLFLPDYRGKETDRELREEATHIDFMSTAFPSYGENEIKKVYDVAISFFAVGALSEKLNPDQATSSHVYNYIATMCTYFFVNDVRDMDSLLKWFDVIKKVDFMGDYDIDEDENYKGTPCPGSFLICKSKPGVTREPGLEEEELPPRRFGDR